jgi:hypothetical protein
VLTTANTSLVANNLLIAARSRGVYGHLHDDLHNAFTRTTHVERAMNMYFKRGITLLDFEYT